jgi:dGTPase
MEWKQLLSTKRIRQLYEGGSGSKQPGEHRSEFDRDYGRTVFSTPVRRLQDKAQVFPLERHDAIRTRLTHSNEVSSVARDLARAAAEWMLREQLIENAEQAEAIATIAATCGLIHDVGNPPFGHAGEFAMREWFTEQFKQGLLPELGGKDTQEANDFLRFEGNAQTQRLLSKLQVLADLYGLNLTCGTLSASCKYVARSHELNPRIHECSKTGFFTSENELMDKVRDEAGTGTVRNPITYLVEAADDIVYSTVDLEDGIKKGVLTWDILKNEVVAGCEGDKMLVNRAIKDAHEKIDPANFIGKQRDDAIAQSFRSFAIFQMVNAALDAFKKHYPAIMNGEYHGALLKDSAAAGLVDACKKIGRERVYVSNETLKLEIFGNRTIKELMTLFWRGVREFKEDRKLTGFDAKIYHLASPNYRFVFEQALKKTGGERKAELYVKLQLVTDQVCGMTDTYARDLYRELTNG